MTKPTSSRAAAALAAAVLAAGAAGGVIACGDDDEGEETIKAPDSVTAPSGAETVDTVAEPSKSLGGAPPSGTPQEAGGAESGKPPGTPAD